MTRKNRRQKARTALLALLAAQIGGGPMATLPLVSPKRTFAQEIGNPADRLQSLPPLPGRSEFGAMPGAQPQSHSAVVNTIELPTAFVASVSTALEMRYRDIAGVQISPDVRGSRLVILAPEALQRQIQREAMEVYAAESRSGGKPAHDAGARMADGSLQVRLASISWREFEDSLQRVAGKRIPVTTSQNGERASFQLTGAPLEGTKIEVDRRENVVTVVAPEPAMPGWQKMIRSLDQTTAGANDVIEMVRVVNAKPAPIQRAIRLLDQLPGGESAALLPTGPGDDPLRNVVFQPPAAQPPAQPPAQQPTQQQDQQADPQDDVGGGIIGDTQIQFVPELGIIIVRGPRRDTQRVLDVIRQIEQQSEVTQPEVEVYRLQHLDNAAAAALLNELYEDVLAARQGEVTITPLDHPNALLLIGRREALASAINVIEKIDLPLDATSRLQVFRLSHASAIDAEETVRGFFVDRPGVEDELRPGLGTRVRILADYRTNSLIVGASPRDLQEVADLLRQLDVDQIPAQNEIRVFPLRNSLAADLAPVLQTAINGEGDATTPENLTRPSTSLSIVSLDSQTGGVIDSGILAGVVVTSDANANAIVVRGPSSSMSLIGELIRQLDQVPGVESLVKVFTIENGDAVQLSTALQELFSQAANQGVGQGNLAGLAPATAASSSLVNLRFSTDLRTNSIIASGSASDLEVVESILLRLDTSGFAERITEVIWLRHQSAPEIALAIQEYVQRRVQGVNMIQQFQQGGLGPFDLPDRDLVVVAEVETNSLLLSVSPRLYSDVRRLIDSLDRRPPMVLIKVVIAEVLLDDLFELGGEIGLQDSLLFDRGRALTTPGAGTPGFNFNNNGSSNVSAIDPATVASRAVSTFGLGTSSTAAGFGGFVLSAASDSFSLLLRSLQNANRAQILSRPQIMTVDNKVGFINVGQQVARVNGLSQGTLGAPPILNVTDVEVGLTLEVLPRVGADGMISMQIVARRSEVDRTTGTGTPIGTDPNGIPIIIPDINETRAESTIVAYSGQTVVFGGLIQKNRSNQSRRVPYLADIPLVGVMFRFDREAETRSELLIIMTPMLVNGDEDLEYVKQVESSRMSYCLADMVEMHGDVGLSGGYGLWGPAVGPTIYPDLHPTIDQFPQVIEGEIYHDKLYGPSMMIESSQHGMGAGQVEMLTPPQPTYPEQPTPAPQGSAWPPSANLPPSSAYPPGSGYPPELNYTPGAVGPQATPMRELPPGRVPTPAPGQTPVPGQTPAPGQVPAPGQAPGPQGLEQAWRGSYPPAQPGVAPAATAMPAGVNPPGRYVKPADFKFIDGNAAAELSGFAK